MVVGESLTSDLLVFAFTFALGSIISWLVWLTLRHYNYGKPAYEALAGSELDDGHLSTTDDRFNEIEDAHVDLAERVDKVENKVDAVDEKTDRNYRLLEKIAEKAGVDGIFFRGGANKPDEKSPKSGDD